mmetsp:Transcript_71904/g.227203  ORF Transcript_71904/g.227203 Transcript_71904/m.227203 type:complete len:341 (+) Transcript_71904:116-1138(+)
MQELVLLRRLDHVHAAPPQVPHQLVGAAAGDVGSGGGRARAAVGGDEDAGPPDARRAVHEHRCRARALPRHEAVHQAGERQEPVHGRLALVPPPRHRQLRPAPHGGAQPAPQRAHGAVRRGVAGLLLRRDHLRVLLPGARRPPVLRQVAVVLRRRAGVQHDDGRRAEQEDHAPEVPDGARERVLRRDVGRGQVAQARDPRGVDVRHAQGARVNAVLPQGPVSGRAVQAAGALLRGPVRQRQRPPPPEVLVERCGELALEVQGLRGLPRRLWRRRSSKVGQLCEVEQLLAVKCNALVHGGQEPADQRKGRFHRVCRIVGWGHVHRPLVALQPRGVPIQVAS